MPPFFWYRSGCMLFSLHVGIQFSYRVNWLKSLSNRTDKKWNLFGTRVNQGLSDSKCRLWNVFEKRLSSCGYIFISFHGLSLCQIRSRSHTNRQNIASSRLIGSMESDCIQSVFICIITVCELSQKMRAKWKCSTVWLVCYVNRNRAPGCNIISATRTPDWK